MVIIYITLLKKKLETLSKCIKLDRYTIFKSLKLGKKIIANKKINN